MRTTSLKSVQSTTAQPQHPSDRPRRPGLQQAVLIAVLATVLYLALLIFIWGFISLITNTDVINERVGPLVGPVIAAASTVLVFAGCMVQLRNQRGWLVPIVTAAAVYLGPPLIAALVVAFDRVDLVVGLLFFAARATSPYVPAAAIIGGLLVLLVPLVRGSAAPTP